MLSLTFLLALGPFSPLEDTHWPSFRGENARGISTGRAIPSEWSLETGQNVKWTTEIPGLAHSSPIVWDDLVFVTSAVKQGEAVLKVGLYGEGGPVPDEGVHSFTLTCLDKETGAILWEEVAHEGVPRVKRHPKASHASSTPATDGQHVIAFFGSEGLYAYDVEGTLLWKKDLGVLDAGAPGMRDYQWGFASSPVIHEGYVIVQCDVQDQSFLAAFDIDDGSEIWRTLRDEDPTWSTPTVAAHDGYAMIVANGYKHIGGYDLESGEEMWRIPGGGDVPVPTPVVGNGLAYITNAHGRLAPIYAIRLGATGELSTEKSEEFLAWYHPRRGNYMQTPLLLEEWLYCCNDAGVLACYEADTGEERYRERLGDGTTGFSASPVACGGNIYFTSEEGEIVVVRAGPEFEIVGRNTMGETSMATPAISDGTLFVRTRNRLAAIAEGQS